MLEYTVLNTVEEAFKKVLPVGIDLIREYPTSSGRRVDFVLVKRFEILACIEVKSDLSIRRLLADAQKQVLLYQKETHSYWAIVTDGNRYYINSSDNKFEEIESAETVLQIILGINGENDRISTQIKDKSEIELLRIKLAVICKEYDSSFSTIEKTKNVLATVSSENCEVSSTRFSFKRSFENQFFQALLGSYVGKEIVRYIPFASAYRSLNEQTIGLVSLIGMNDVSECYYADQYISRKKGEELSKTILPIERKLLNNTYILSCNDLEKEDDLTMWRLYGDNCKGICIKMQIENDIIDKNDTFILAPVSYGIDKDNHPELEFVNSIMSLNIGGKNLTFETWCYWKHFFKDYRYSVEKEVRLLYTGGGFGKRSWILVNDNEIPCTISIFPVKSLPNHSNDFPLTLSGIIIGSKCTDIDTKKSQFEELIKERNAGYDKGFAEVKASVIDNYR